MAKADLVTDAWARHQRIVALRRLVEQTFLELGEELYHFEREQAYRKLGHDSFNAYLADPEVDISRSLAYRLKGVYKTFVLELGSPAARLLEAGADKLDVIRPHVDEGNVDEWLDTAATLSRSDLKHEVKLAFDPPEPAPPGAVIGEVNGNRITLWCQTREQVEQVMSRLGGLVEWQ
ncbi:MAG: hypothetical protein PVJ86_04020 [Phycisphaerales bacterium]|jgi:hypothetical protein